MTAVRKETLTIHELRKIVLKLTNDPNINPSTRKTALHSPKFLHFFSILGMTPEQLCSTNPDLFREDYDETVFKPIKFDINESTAEAVYLAIQKYGFMPVMSALELKEAKFVEDELKKFGFPIKVYDHYSIRVFNEKFYQEMNGILRKANPSLKVYKENEGVENEKAATPQQHLDAFSPLNVFSSSESYPDSTPVNEVPEDDFDIKINTLIRDLYRLNISNKAQVSIWIRSMNMILSGIFPDANPALFNDRMSQLVENLRNDARLVEKLLEIKESAPKNIYLQFLLAAQLQKNKDKKSIKDISIRDIKEAIEKLPKKEQNLGVLAKRLHPDIDRKDLVIFFATIGMSLKELASCPPEIFGDDYYEPIRIKRMYPYLKPIHKQSLATLVNTYGHSQIATALGYTNINNFFTRLENTVFLKLDKATLPKKPGLKYEGAFQFFDDLNELFRSCDPEIPNYRKKWEEWRKEKNLPELPSRSNVGRIEIDKVSLPENSNVINLTEDSDEEELQTTKKQKRSHSPTLFPNIFENVPISTIDRDGLTFALYMLNDTLNQMTKMNTPKLLEWLDQLDDALNPYFSQAHDEESHNRYVWELGQMMPAFDVRKLHDLIVAFPDKINLRMLYHAQMLKEEQRNQPFQPPR